MNITVQGVPRFEFEGVTLTQVESLMHMASIHYDGRCQQAAAPAHVLGRWKRQLEGADKINATIADYSERYNPLLEASSDELQTLCKITEFINYTGVEKRHVEIGAAFHMRCISAINKFNDLYRQWRVEV